MSSVLMVRLVPMEGPEDEDELSIPTSDTPFSERHVVVLTDDDDDVNDHNNSYSSSTITTTKGCKKEIIIGRGCLTGITDPSIPKKAFRLSLDKNNKKNNNGDDETTPHVQATRYAQSIHCTAQLYINGLPWDDDQPIVHLVHGDIVALNQDKYMYRVEIKWTTARLYKSEGDESRKNMGRKGGQSTTSSHSQNPIMGNQGGPIHLEAPAASGIVIPKESASRVSEQIQCSVCLDILVHPRTLNPCGHSLCGSCLASLQQPTCPNCRQTVVSDVPAVQLEGLISTLVGIHDLLDADDVEHYHKRKRQQTVPTPSAASRKKLKSTDPNGGQPRPYSTIRNPYINSASSSRARNHQQASRRAVAPSARNRNYMDLVGGASRSPISIDMTTYMPIMGGLLPPTPPLQPINQYQDNHTANMYSNNDTNINILNNDIALVPGSSSLDAIVID